MVLRTTHKFPQSNTHGTSRVQRYRCLVWTTAHCLNQEPRYSRKSRIPNRSNGHPPLWCYCVVVTMLTLVLTMVPLNRTAGLWQSKVTPLPTISPSPPQSDTDLECHVWRDLWWELRWELETLETMETLHILSRPCINKSCSYLTVSHVLKSDKSWRHRQ